MKPDVEHGTSIPSLAQRARQSLARALEALQARGAPLGLLDVAQPVARAIGGLVDMELSPRTASSSNVEAVLEALRDALGLLQAPEYVEHPAAALGMKGVAEALAATVTLARAVPPRAPSPELVLPGAVLPATVLPATVLPATVLPATVLPATVLPATVLPATVLPAAVLLQAIAPSSAEAAPPSPRLAIRPGVSSLAPVSEKSAPALMTRALPDSEPPQAGCEPPAPSSEPRPAQQERAARHEPRSAVSAEPPPIVIPPAIAITEARTEPSRRPSVALRRDVIIERDLRAVEAPLGAHSPSNFYTGLAGGDVVASGGLFVATYQVPNVGEKVLLKISMPGGYEFVAKAKVAWTRNAATTLSPGSMRVGSPGFGAQFCEITDEGRRLIQRYVRNREPLFHEDAP